MRKRFVWRAVLVGVLMAGALGACGDDDDDETTTDTTAAGAAGSDDGDNTLAVEMVDYGYEVDGELKAGLATITSTNTGDEWHMAGFGRLKEGRTVAELVTALQAAGGGGGEEGGPPGEGGAGEEGAPADTSAEGGEPAAGQEGEQGGEDEPDPLAEFIEEELGTPGHILQPGQTQSLTVDVLDAGSYVMLCFLPTEGEGTPHFAKGMVAGFEVAEEAADVAQPEADATITLADEAEPEGVPTDLQPGEHTFQVTSTGNAGHDFIIGQLEEGQEFEAFDAYFDEGFEAEGGPPVGFADQAPGTLVGSTFEIGPGQTLWLTVDVPAGETYFVNTTNTEDDSGEEQPVDKSVKVNVG